MKVLFTDHDFPDLSIERDVLEGAGIELVVAQCRTVEDVIRESAGCAALLIEYAPVDARVFAARPEIGLCSRIGAGFDTINTADAQEHGVWVANSPDYGSSEVALHALALALSLLRHLPRYDAGVRRGVWDAHATGACRRLANLTVGVLGYGRIGSRFAYFAHTMFKQVIACDPYRIDGDFAPYVEPVGMEALFERADVLSIHTPLNNETRGLVNARYLGLMHPGSYLINTARGAVVDLDDLCARLEQFDGIGLDVLPVEPIAPDSPLLSAPHVILTPHAAYYTTEAARDLRRKAARNIVSWMHTGRPDYAVVRGRRAPPAR